MEKTDLHLKTAGNSKRTEVHSIPCKIEHDGEASVDAYFRNTIEKNDGHSNEEFSAIFRGRPLKGKILEVPAGFEGIVWKEGDKPVTEEDDSQWHEKGRFENISYWNLQNPPTVDDSFIKATYWSKMAEQIHAPVDEKKMKSED